MKSDISQKYTYAIISKSNRDSESLKIVSEVYKAWYGEWEKVFSNQNRNFKPSVDDFLRQDLVTVIFFEMKIVGFHFYSFFDLLRIENTYHSYFNKIDPASFETLKKQNIKSVMSMEYLTVMPEFRKTESGIPWGEVFISLGSKVLKESPADSAFGTARRDVKVGRMAQRVGFDFLQAPIIKYDYECEVVYYPAHLTPLHPDPKIQSLITTLWDSRIDFQKNKKLQKIAA